MKTNREFIEGIYPFVPSKTLSLLAIFSINIGCSLDRDIINKSEFIIFKYMDVCSDDTYHTPPL